MGSSLNLTRSALLINGLSPGPYTLCTKPLCQHGAGPMGSYWRPPTTQTRRAGSSTFLETVSIQVLVSVTVFLCHYCDVIMGAMASQITSHDCLLNRSLRRRSKKTSKLRVTGLCAGNSPVTGEFPAQMTSNAENVSIWWRHHDGDAPTRCSMDGTTVWQVAQSSVLSYVMQLLLSRSFEISLKKLGQTSKSRPLCLGLNVSTTLKKNHNIKSKYLPTDRWTIPCFFSFDYGLLISCLPSHSSYLIAHYKNMEHPYSLPAIHS